MATTLTLLRHGESIWNREDRFAGWADVPLTRNGVREARQAGRLFAEKGVAFDCAFTSVLRRAVRTLDLVLEETDQSWLPVEKSWRLNERHYGTLEGERRTDTRRAHGGDQTLLWRWSWDVAPPPLDPEDARFPGHDRRYAELRPSELPRGESLKEAAGRVVPYYESAIAPRLRAGQRVLVVAHGSSLRSLVKHLEGVSDADVEEVRVPTGEPLLYELGDDEAVLARRRLRARRPIRIGRWLGRQWVRRIRLRG